MGTVSPEIPTSVFVISLHQTSASGWSHGMTTSCRGHAFTHSFAHQISSSGAGFTLRRGEEPSRDDASESEPPPPGLQPARSRYKFDAFCTKANLKFEFSTPGGWVRFRPDLGSAGNMKMAFGDELPFE